MNKIIEIKFGSWLYGTNTPSSDLDFKGIYLPTAKEIVLGSYKKTIANVRAKQECERNTKDDIDYEYFSLDRYLELLTQGQTVALDFLFGYADNFITLTPEGVYVMHDIFNNREKLLTRNVNAFVGYARMQAAKYGIKGSRMDAIKRVKEFLTPLPPYSRLQEYSDEINALVAATKELVSLEKTALVEVVLLKGPKGQMDASHVKVNGRSIPFTVTVKYAMEIVDKMLEGYGKRAHKAHLAGGLDWKALSHAVRVNNEAQELLTTGHITFPRPDRELLTKIKKGEIQYEIVAELIEQGLADLYTAHEKSTLRDTPDQDWVDNFVYDVYSKIVKDSTHRI